MTAEEVIIEAQDVKADMEQRAIACELEEWVPDCLLEAATALVVWASKKLGC